MRKATILASDRHYGDRAQYISTMREATRRAIQVVKNFKPDTIECIENGDTVSGRDIFSHQGLQNAVQLGRDQVWLALHDMQQWHQALADIAPTEWVFVQGNHDEVARESLVPGLVQTARMLGLAAKFGGRVHVGNFAPEGAEPHYYEAQHGFQGSGYYANGASEIVAAMRSHIEYTLTLGKRIQRFLRGHTHWVNVGQAVAYDCVIDTTGGWHRNERMKLPSAMRDTGLLVYLHNGKDLRVVPVMADSGLLQDETYNRTHNYRVAKEASEALLEMAEWAVEQGIA